MIQVFAKGFVGTYLCEGLVSCHSEGGNLFDLSGKSEFAMLPFSVVTLQEAGGWNKKTALAQPRKMSVSVLQDSLFTGIV
jgi:hypothetical protein